MDRGPRGPALGRLVGERADRAIARPGTNDLSVADHVALPRAAAFTSAGTVWRCGDDNVLVGVR